MGQDAVMRSPEAAVLPPRSLTATERAYAYTKARVLDSTFRGGELLSEGEVAQALGCSRTPVREAFLRLETEGLLRLYPKRGALVVPVSPEEVESVMETRLVIERFALEKVARQGLGPGLAPRLDELLERQRERFAAGDAPGFVEADREFHRLYVETAGNSIVLGLYDSLRDRQRRMGVVAIARDSARSGQILREHDGLVRALEAGDRPRLQRLLAVHLQGTLARLQGAGVHGLEDAEG